MSCEVGGCCPAPRVLPHRPPGECSLPTAELDGWERFTAGHWAELLAQAAAAVAGAPALQQSRPQCDGQPARRATILVHLEKLSAASRALTEEPRSVVLRNNQHLCRLSLLPKRPGSTRARPTTLPQETPTAGYSCRYYMQLLAVSTPARWQPGRPMLTMRCCGKAALGTLRQAPPAAPAALVHALHILQQLAAQEGRALPVHEKRGVANPRCRGQPPPRQHVSPFGLGKLSRCLTDTSQQPFRRHCYMFSWGNGRVRTPARSRRTASRESRPADPCPGLDIQWSACQHGPAATSST